MLRQVVSCEDRIVESVLQQIGYSLRLGDSFEKKKFIDLYEE
jgi:hypothetical protein